MRTIGQTRLVYTAIRYFACGLSISIISEFHFNAFKVNEVILYMIDLLKRGGGGRPIFMNY